VIPLVDRERAVVLVVLVVLVSAIGFPFSFLDCVIPSYENLESPAYHCLYLTVIPDGVPLSGVIAVVISSE
jgi:hypothetical protein